MNRYSRHPALPRTSGNSEAIEVDGLRKRFGPTVALDGMTFSVPPERVTGFVGPLTFLAARDMLIPDHGRQTEPRQHAVQRLLASLPGQFGREATSPT